VIAAVAHINTVYLYNCICTIRTHTSHRGNALYCSSTVEIFTLIRAQWMSRRWWWWNIHEKKVVKKQVETRSTALQYCRNLNYYSSQSYTISDEWLYVFEIVSSAMYTSKIASIIRHSTTAAVATSKTYSISHYIILSS